MNSIILASGTQTRWQQGLKKGLPQYKSLIKIKGKPLIKDIQDKFPGSEVCTVHKEIQKQSNKWFAPYNYRWLLETLFWTYKHWGSDSTLILLGDVYYGKDLIKKIMTFNDPVFNVHQSSLNGTTKFINTDYIPSRRFMFFGNSTDLLALYFEREFNDFLITALRFLVKQCEQRIHQGKLWHLYRFTQAIPFNKDEIKDNITIVSDSRDFDNCEQYLKFLACLKKSR